MGKPSAKKIMADGKEVWAYTNIDNVYVIFDSNKEIYYNTDEFYDVIHIIQLAIVQFQVLV